MRHLELILAGLIACAPGAGGDDLQEDTTATVERADAGRASTDPASEDRAEPVGREAARLTATLDRYDFDDPTHRFELPGRLEEISGLVMTADGRLFGHDDERGRVHEIDPVTGDVGKSFDLGSGTTLDDFEGIAAVGERLFLVSSPGFLYEFREGDDEADVPYRVTDTRLGARCEVEGLDYDPDVGALLFACKQTAPERGAIEIHRIPVAPGAAPLASIRVDRRSLDSVGLARDFQPSAVAVTARGTLILLSAPTESILEIDREGRVLAGVVLGEGDHAQPEGLAVGADGALYIADEENDEDAMLTVYTPRGAAP